jgi:hypothetical protein
MENNIPTAEDFLQDSFTISHFYNDKYNRMSCFSDDVQEAMIGFAKLHIQAALKEASEKAKQIEDPYAYTGNTGSEYPADYIIDKDSILNAYALENIK